ncbi:uncharacterized protein KY384_007707 [Bacidia gigantensis]|uniref:uncharacterized protein n=1 Tax=Bacidia gigantensis TaxID=2732470 RepID=UPI001D05A2B2|nr:uncharacterized protein KY384_007707 [Bacidia gigantensis]KAG8527555.1 hypothetical protein KY384_007707 [Bacidia gigantensis]
MAIRIVHSDMHLRKALSKTETDITINSCSSTSTASSYEVTQGVITCSESSKDIEFLHSRKGLSRRIPRRSIDPTSTVRKLKPSETRHASLCLAEAFIDDDTARYFTHTPDRASCSDQDQWNLHVFIMEQLVRAHIVCGLATVIGDNYDSVALWMPPGKTMDGLKSRMHKVLRKCDFEGKLSEEGMTRFFDDFFPKLHETKHEILGSKCDANSWYLVYVGTKIGSRKRGYARKLIQHTLDKADKQKVPCYLESSNEANTKLYNSLGFVHMRDIELTRAEEPVKLDIMTRQPVKTKSNRSKAARG